MVGKDTTFEGGFFLGDSRRAVYGYKLRRKTHTLACGMKVAFTMKKTIFLLLDISIK